MSYHRQGLFRTEPLLNPAVPAEFNSSLFIHLRNSPSFLQFFVSTPQHVNLPVVAELAKSVFLVFGTAARPSQVQNEKIVFGRRLDPLPVALCV